MLREKKYLLYPYQIYKYVVIYPLLGASTALFGTLAALFSIFVNVQLGTFMGVLWARVNSFFTPMFVNVSGKENIDPEQSYVVVANHQSLYDIFVIYGWFPYDFRWVMKIEARRIPFLGYSCYKIGHIFIDRSNRQAAIESINTAKERLKKGTSVMFFPEGTRSTDGKLLPFKKGAFVLALDMELPILPVSIVGTKDIVPNRTTALFPGKAEMIIHEPISIQGYTHENMDELMKKAVEKIEDGLNRGK